MPYITWGLIQDFKKRTIKRDPKEKKGGTTELKFFNRKYEE